MPKVELSKFNVQKILLKKFHYAKVQIAKVHWSQFLDLLGVASIQMRLLLKGAVLSDSENMYYELSPILAFLSLLCNVLFLVAF